ncbi:MAG: hypothetical protein JXB32_21160 [Deltaproteobacteria bacterium]|nr:hypothetical protein [Deltaproteobacteria bacterium]
MRRHLARLPLLAAAALSASACPSSAPDAAEPRDRTVYGHPDDPAQPAGPTAVPRAVCPEPTPDATTREELLHVLDDGVGRLLAHLRLAPVLDRQGPGARFVGHRIVALDDFVRCGAFGLREGDVVTAVNDHGVERDSDAVEIWEQLFTATSITLTVVRGGVETALSLTVLDEPVRIDNTGVSTVEDPGS